MTVQLLLYTQQNKLPVMARAFWIKCIVLFTILSASRGSLTFDNDDTELSGFGYELLITKMELLEHKYVGHDRSNEA